MVAAGYQSLRRFVLGAALLMMATANGMAGARPINLVAFGDSLTAGYMLPPDAGFAPVLQKALRDKGFDVVVGNGGVSGDTAQAGLDRLDWSVPEGTDAVIVELGANDMLRGYDPAATQKTLDTILTRLQARHIKVLLTGMDALMSLGEDYVTRFKAIYPVLAQAHDVPLYPFFLDGMVHDKALHLPDGLHPNAEGVEVIVKNILPSVEQLLKSVPDRG